MYEEVEELRTKAHKLKEYLDNRAHKRCNQLQCQLMSRQLQIMREYIHILELRINNDIEVEEKKNATTPD